MKKTVLILFFGISAFIASAQTEKRSPQISVYPNPATDYIKLTDDDLVRTIYVSNMLGRKVRAFDASKSERYEIGDLPNGFQPLGAFPIPLQPAPRLNEQNAELAVG